ncbi:hypothetical protein [Lacrimispora sp.]|uniref:hypothetical protein n=1 Tax=Lacrimispora sp. TaxID=2719234 RepID=UPI0028A7EF7A|nr:hypothetical protein [Lacrimispora sp.]
MNDLEKLEQKAYEEKIIVDYIDFKSKKIQGLYCDGSIAVNSALQTTASKADVLAEELGHHFTTSGNIINPKIVVNQKQERTARLWGFNARIGLNGIINAFKAHCENVHDVSEYLNVSEATLKEALEYYRQIYGTGTMVDNYFLQFEPRLQVHTLIAIE